MFHKELLKLYFICGTTTCQGKNLYTVVEEALKGGITLFQFREKGEGALEGLEKLELAIQIKELCKNTMCRLSLMMISIWQWKLTLMAYM
ncbi:thiamine-phosphate pyrophosphorylase [Streptococcus pneumoniae 2072047]|nr:thiamine-phosphate pyrophosphorylase [Streptococcus pneumoniae 2072047]